MTKRRVRHVPRERDEEVLSMLAMRHRGVTTGAIAFLFRCRPDAVVAATRAVLAADIKESGEPEGRVREGYW